MNPITQKSISSLFILKKELKFVLFTFLLVLLLPIVATITLTQVGIDFVSDTLISQNAKNGIVEIKDPRTGKTIKVLSAQKLWPAHGYVTLEFGEVNLPYQPLHTGIDIGGRIGDPVRPFAPGVVIYAGEINWGFGRHVIIDHGDNINSIYAHLDKILVKNGEKIESTDKIIGLLGDTGWSTGPHLHFQINVFGIPVNPRTFLTGNP